MNTQETLAKHVEVNQSVAQLVLYGAGVVLAARPGQVVHRLAAVGEGLQGFAR